MPDADAVTEGRTVRPIERIELEALVRTGAVVLVEALGPAFFADVRLPGARNIPPDEVDRLAPILLPDRVATVAVYCSRTCANAEVTARRLVELGYLDVRLYAAGKEDWIEADLPAERG